MQDWKGGHHPAGRRPASSLRTSRRLIRIRFLSIIVASRPVCRGPDTLCIGDFRSRSEADRFAVLIAGRRNYVHQFDRNSRSHSNYG
jgi:hypothetical protein